jgi:hypothetical protein
MTAHIDFAASLLPGPARKRKNWPAVTCLCLALGSHAQSSAAQTTASDEPQANPARPTVATPATLTPVGYLQFETGFLGAIHSPEFSSRYGLNEVIKLSVAPRLEFLANSEPAVRFTSNRHGGSGAADTLVGLQTVLIPGEGAKPTVAASYLRRVYNGTPPDLDFGTSDNSFLALASADVKGFHYDANAFFNELVQHPVRRAQFGQMLSVSHPLVKKFSLTGEIWHFTQPFLQGHAAGNLWAVSYAANRTLVFDFGFDRGLTSTSTRWEFFAGFTYLLPRRL